jgi:hypothetical protein
MNCLGKLSRDSGHMRVPDPPHMITGKILVIISSVPTVATDAGILWTDQRGKNLNLNHAAFDVKDRWVFGTGLSPAQLSRC